MDNPLPPYAAGLSARLWSEASPEQRRLTYQLVRNGAYFGAAALLIAKYGDQLAI